MSARSWLFLAALIVGTALLVWDELRRERRADPYLRAFRARIAARYRSL